MLHVSAAVFCEPDDLSFGSVIRGYIENPRFVRRDWLAAASLADQVAKAVLYGNYPRPSAGELNIDRLCDRSTFLAIASQEAETSATGETRLTLRWLCENVLVTQS